MSISMEPELAMERERETYLVYYVNNSLRVVSKEATDRVILILFVREYRLDQGAELVRIESAFDQTFTGWC